MRSLKNFVDGNEAVGGFDGVDFGVVRMRGEFAATACHLEDEFAGGDVPEGYTGFNVGVEAAASSVSHAEGGAAHHAHFAAAEGGFAKAFEANLERFFVFAASDEDDGFFELGTLADPKGLVVEQNGASFFGSPSFVRHGVVDDAGYDFLAVSEGDGDAEVGDAVEEVDGAVDGIDDPLIVGFLIAADAFFAIEGVVGELAGDALKDEVLGFAVELELEVVVLSFVDIFGLMKVVVKKLAGLLGGTDSEF